MGLDITAYKNLKEVMNCVLDEDGYPVDEDTLWKPGPSMDWSESVWPGKGSPIKSNAIYEWDDTFDFRAGSYSGYGEWRDTLAKFKGDVAFQELIDFADNEGVIGSKLAKKLYNDFCTYYEEAKATFNKTEDDKWFIAKYEAWMEAFKYASENGAVDFH